MSARRLQDACFKACEMFWQGEPESVFLLRCEATFSIANARPFWTAIEVRVAADECVRRVLMQQREGVEVL